MTAPKQMTSGQAVPIIRIKDDGGFELDKDAMQRILQSPDVQDKPVAVVSVAGAFRKGKSFLLNFFLRYMHNEGRGDWMGDADTPLEGFSWSGGCERNTTGILLWDKVFLVNRPDGSQVAVLLMDTQGSFDSYTTVKGVATIFALSTLTCSVQVYNLSQNIQEDDLQHLQFFAEYGRLAQPHESSEKPFQKLVFLVRDWAHPTDAEYGSDGGTILLNMRLNPPRTEPENQRLRDCIKSCFSELCCFLLPYPGLKVATGRSTMGYLQDMNDDFKNHLQEFVSSVLAGDKLVTKKINGEQITCKDWVTYFSVRQLTVHH